jgi:hypothetical protein
MRPRTLLIILASLLALYAIVGFFVIPPVAKPRLIDAIERTTHRPVTLEGLRVNPFTLSATLEDFHLKDRDSVDLVRFAELYVNYDILSLFRNAYIFDEIRIDRPYLAARVLADGKLSIHDLLDRQPPQPERRDTTPARLVIGSLAVHQGTLYYEDLSRPVPLRKHLDSLDLFLSNFTTMPDESGNYEFEANTRSGEYLHWKGRLSVTPLQSEGLVELKHLHAQTLAEFMAHRLKFRIDLGVIDVSAGYSFDGTGDEPVFHVKDGAVSVQNLVISDPADSLSPLVLPAARATGISFAYPEQKVIIDRISATEGQIHTAYTADGRVTLQELLTPLADPADTSASQLTLQIREIAGEGMIVVFTEQMMQPEAVFTMTDLSLSMKNLCYGMPGTATLGVRGVLNGTGSAEATGTLSLDPQRGDLTLRIRGTPLAAFQPYAYRYSRASLDAGTISAQGKFSYATRGTQTVASYRGSVTVDGARISDPVMKEDLARWRKLELKEMNYRSFPPSLAIREIAAREPYARVVIGPDRLMNIQHVMGGEDTLGGEPAGTEGKGPMPGPPTAGQRTTTTIDSVRLEGGNLNFTDLSLRPNFTVSIMELQGAIRGLSSEQLARADVDLSGKVDKYAPVTIRGEINPLSEQAYTDIMMRFQGIELTTFTPYSGKFAGYKIDRGKMNMDLRYKLNKRYLEGENKIVLDQLTLGEKIEGPDVTSLPVKLAVALLKDSKGVIDLDIPVSGSLDDPEFSLFPIILKVLMNLLWKIVTAPFALIGALFGGSGDDLQFVGFAPGTDSLALQEREKLSTVAKGLVERPGLQLDLRGTSSATADRDALAEASIMKKIRTAGEGPLTRAETERLLALYRQTFSEDPAALVPEGTVKEEDRPAAIRDASQRRLVASVKISDEELRALAQRRAGRVRDHLTGPGGIAPERIFLQDVDTAVNPTDGMIRTQLNLTAR